jgi:hypothetical protein
MDRLAQGRQDTMGASCEYGNEHSVHIKQGDFTDQQRHYELPKTHDTSPICALNTDHMKDTVVTYVDGARQFF